MCRAKYNDIARCHTSLDHISIAIRIRANDLEKMSKHSWLAPPSKLTSAKIPIRLCSQANTLAPYNLPIPLHNQRRRAINVQVNLTRRNTATCTTTTRRLHWRWKVKPINQTNIIEMQWWLRGSKGNFY